jgi:RHS repeat-associated protein
MIRESAATARNSRKGFVFLRCLLPLFMMAGLLAVVARPFSERTSVQKTHLSHSALASSTSITQSLAETYGGTDPIETCGTCEAWGTAQVGTSTPPSTDPADLVNTATGDVNESYTLFSAPSLGNDFYNRLSYDSQYAINYASTHNGSNPYAGPYGWGWISNNNSDVVDITGGSNAGVTVTEATGAQVQFYQEVTTGCGSGPSPCCPQTPAYLVPVPYATITPVYCAEPDVNADFVEYDNYGDYTLYQDGGLSNSTFNYYGQLTDQGTSVFAALIQLTFGVAIGSQCLQNALGQVSTCDVTTDALTSRFYSTGFSLDGLAVQTEDPAGHIWTYGYSGPINGVTNGNNELISITDPNGNSWGFGYDNTAPTGYQYGLTGITDPDGYTTTLTYSHSDSPTEETEGLVTEVADAMSPANATTYAYPDNTCGTCVLGSQQTTVTDSSGNVENYYYYFGLIDKQTQSTDLTSGPYVGLVNTTLYTDSWAGTPLMTTQTIQEPLLPQQTTGTGPFITDVTNGVGDLMSQDIELSSGSAASTTNYGYNSFNEECWQALPGVSDTGASCTNAPSSMTSLTFKTYDAYGDLSSSTEPVAYSTETVGNTTNYGYNSDGQLCWMTLPDQSPGSDPTCTNPPPGASTYDYNSDNEMVSSSTPDGTSPNFTHDTTTNTYNSYGEVLTTVSPDANMTGNTQAEYTTTNTYDTAGRLYQVQAPYLASSSATTTATLDAAGNVLTVTDGAGLVTTNQYDADNRLCWTIDSSESSPPGCGAPPTGATSYTYRGATSDVTSEVDPDQHTTTTTYLDPFYPDSPTTIKDPNGDVTSNYYDLDGNLCVTGAASSSPWLTVPPPSAPPSCIATTGYTFREYDQFHNVIQSTDPLDNTTNYTYGEAEYPSLVSETSPPSPEASTLYTYDNDGELINTQQGSDDISAAYTPTGNVCWRAPTNVTAPSCSSPPSNIDTLPGTSFYAYYASELPSLMEDVVNSTTEDATAWVYDDQGQLTQEVNNGGTVNYAYDPAGDNICVGYPITTADYENECTNSQNELVSPGLQSNGEINSVVDYTYDADGRMISLTPWTTPGDLTFNYAGGTSAPDEARNEVTSVTGFPTVTVGSTQVSIATEERTYDAADNPLTDDVTEPLSVTGGGFSDSFTPNTDDLIGTENSNSYTYTPYYQVLDAGPETFQDYTNGEIYKDTVGGTTTTDTYNSDSELTKSAGSSTTKFGFDAQGNRCAQIVSSTAPSCSSPPSTATTYGFSAYNQLCWTGSGGTTSGEGTCSSAPSESTTYSYDGSGLRVSDSANGGQNFVYDTQTRSGQPLIMMDGTNAYIYGPASFGTGTGPVEQIPLLAPVTPAYLFSDPSGVRSVLSVAGLISKNYSFNAYGTRTSSGSGSTTSFGFQGGYTDPSGLVYFVDRYYDPTTDQFISVDPDVAESGQPYAFVGDDPVNETDPTGKVPTCGGQSGACEQSSPGRPETFDAPPPPVMGPPQNSITEGFIHANPNSYESAAEFYNSAAPPGADRQTYYQFFVQSYEGNLITVPDNDFIELCGSLVILNGCLSYGGHFHASVGVGLNTGIFSVDLAVGTVKGATADQFLCGSTISISKTYGVGIDIASNPGKGDLATGFELGTPNTTVNYTYGLVNC